jgi:hypothetical protein
MDITGFPVYGKWLHKRAGCGRQVSGVGLGVHISGTADIGERMLDFTVELITAMVMEVSVMPVDTGAMELSITILP